MSMLQPPRHDPNREIKTMYDFRSPKHLLGDPTEECPRVKFQDCIELESPPPEIVAVHNQFSRLQALLRSGLYISRGGDDVLEDIKVGREFELRLWWFLKERCRLEVSPPDLTLFVAGSPYEPAPIVDGGRKILGMMAAEAKKALEKAIGEPIHPSILIDAVNSPTSAWMGDLAVVQDNHSIAIHCKTTVASTIQRTLGRPSITVGRGARSKGADPHILRFPSDEVLAFGVQQPDKTFLLAFFESWEQAASVPSVPVQDSLIGEKVCFYLDDLAALNPASFPPNPEQIRRLINSIKRDRERGLDLLEKRREHLQNLAEKLQDSSETQRKQILREMQFAEDDPALKW